LEVAVVVEPAPQGPQDGGPPPQPRGVDHLFTRPRYSPVRVSILMIVPCSMNSGTCTVAPVASVADLLLPWAVFPFTPGSVSVISSSTNVGASTETGRPL